MILLAQPELGSAGSQLAVGQLGSLLKGAFGASGGCGPETRVNAGEKGSSNFPSSLKAPIKLALKAIWGTSIQPTGAWMEVCTLCRRNAQEVQEGFYPIGFTPLRPPD